MEPTWNFPPENAYIKITVWSLMPKVNLTLPLNSDSFLSELLDRLIQGGQSLMNGVDSSLCSYILSW